MKVNQKGFGAVEIFVTIVIVGLIATVGWLVYDRQSNKAQTGTTKQAEQAKKEVDTTNTTEYKSDELGLSLRYPTEWGTASLVEGPLSKPQSGKYSQLSFSNLASATINFVTGPYSSPLDACGYSDPVQNAIHDQNANQASLIGWDANNIKRYMTGQGFDEPTVYKQGKTAGDTGPGYTEISTNDKVMVYKDINNNPVEVGGSEDCGTITQAQADAANAYAKFFHFATNYSNNKVFGVNGQFDARKGDNETTRNQLTSALNTIK